MRPGSLFAKIRFEISGAAVSDRHAWTFAIANPHAHNNS